MLYNKIYQFITMEEINIFNLYDYVRCDIEGNLLKISWDSNNPILNSLMMKERQPYSFVNENCMYSCKWVEEIKKHICWEAGNPIHIRIQELHTDGRFWVYFYDKPQEGSVNEKIDENGYLITAYYSFYTSYVTDLIRVNCYYNDLMDEEQSLYTLK